ncbi:PepSY domain-containing protein [Aquitalea magnusonii]|uniref:Putative iron-regulated membrane protein n=2 Tax=Aquitalea magnusonii TaxID=332411 RepID=A0A318J524_9NEIS|nr:PepSY domain-containing protein [Aquitalea magnusonii]PXX41801.1 putative iron-regulated membrane protein [Aquitalea magnusonii]
MKRLLFLGHRWLGILLCLLLVLWSFSGLLMIYAGPSSISESTRLAHAPALTPAASWLSAGAAWRLGMPTADSPPSSARLLVQAGEPVWLMQDGSGQRYRLSARDGQRHDISAAQAIAIAREWAPGSQPQIRQAPFARDAGTAMMNYDPYRPFYRVNLDDAAQHELTISQRTGEVIKASSRLDRLLFWGGSYLHFLRPLDAIGLADARKSIQTWSALASLLAVLSGLYLGLCRWRPGWLGQRRYPNGSSNPYRALWQRWHLWLGLCGGLLALSWTLSGFLSNNPWQLFSGHQGQGRSHHHATAAALPATALDFPMAQVVAQLAGQHMVELNWYHAGPLAMLQARDAQLRSRIITTHGFELAAGQREFPAAALLASAQAMTGHAAIRQAERLLAADDYYYPDRHQDSSRRPLPVWRIQLADQPASWLYLNPQTGEKLLQLDRSQRTFRWLFSGLHNWDQAIMRPRPWWDGWMLTSSLAVLALSISALVLAGKRLRIKAGAARRRRAATAGQSATPAVPVSASDSHSR